MRTLIVSLVLFHLVFGIEILSRNVFENARLLTLDNNDRRSLAQKRSSEDFDPLKSFLEDNNVFQVSDINQIQYSNTFTSKLGFEIRNYVQEYKGLEVFGSGVNVGIENGELNTIGGI